MKILSILERLGDTSFEITETKTQSRRESIFGIGSAGKTILSAALPAGILASFSASAKGSGSSLKSSATITDVLNFALTLEHLEANFYIQGLASPVIPNADKAIFNQIRKHEEQHVAFLQTTISSLGGSPVAKPNFDFTAGGKFSPFSQYGDFLALAQAFEDTGVRAYKGQAGNLISSDVVLTAALQIHSVEARHASQVRRLRAKANLDPGNKGWIAGASRGSLPAETQAVYNGEDNLTQGGVNVTTVTSANSTSIQEAFDEPLTQAETEAIASLFIIP